jgi:hypothetical protein
MFGAAAFAAGAAAFVACNGKDDAPVGATSSSASSGGSTGTSSSSSSGTSGPGTSSGIGAYGPGPVYDSGSTTDAGDDAAKDAAADADGG